MLAATAEMFAAEEGSRAQSRLGHAEESLLVEAARRSDRAALTILHDRYAPMIHGMALARVSATEAHDLVQDVFLAAMNKLHALRDSSAFGPWLAQIARHRIAEFHRQRREDRLNVEAGDEIEDHKSSRDGALDEAQRILRVIQSLPAAYAETLALRLVEGLSGPQIAACTGLTEGSVRVNLHRGMQLLRQKLGSEVSP